MKKGLFSLLFLMVPGAAFAQHPCTNPPAQMSVPAGPVNFTTCWDEKDNNNQTVAPKQWAVYVDGVRNVVPFSKTTPTPAPDGNFQYSSTGSVLVAKGNHSVTIEVVIDDGVGGSLSAQATPFLSLQVLGALPHPPVNPRALP